MATTSQSPGLSTESSPAERLLTIDRFLPLWILLSMALGILIGKVFPGIGDQLDRVTLTGVSLPLALGLLWMMYPVLAKVKFGSLGRFQTRRELFGLSMVLNWVIGPLLMFALAWIFLPGEPAYRNGLILIGLARCIAMVLVWNSLACGDGDVAAVLVAFNAVFQIVMYSVLGWLFLTEIPGWFGAETTALDISMWKIAKNVLIFLGIPLLAAIALRVVLVRQKGEAWYENRYLPKIGPTALLGLLYTIVIMFAMQGDHLLNNPFDVLRIALPLVIYFLVMFFLSFFSARRIGLGYEETAAVSFTAAGNNFELAIAVAIGVFGVTSGEALAGVVGPLIEVPVLIALVYVSLALAPAPALSCPIADRHRSAEGWRVRMTGSAKDSTVPALSPNGKPKRSLRSIQIERQYRNVVRLFLAGELPDFTHQRHVDVANILHNLPYGRELMHLGLQAMAYRNFIPDKYSQEITDFYWDQLDGTLPDPKRFADLPGGASGEPCAPSGGGEHA